MFKRGRISIGFALKEWHVLCQLLQMLVILLMFVPSEINGYLYKDNIDENELASMIELLRSNPGRISRLSAKAREIRNKFSFEKVSNISGRDLKELDYVII